MTGYQSPPQWNAPGGPDWGPQQSGPYQGGSYPGGPYPPQPTASIKTYRAQAVTILLCCILFGILPLITGIPALIYSSRVTESISVVTSPRRWNPRAGPGCCAGSAWA